LQLEPIGLIKRLLLGLTIKIDSIRSSTVPYSLSLEVIVVDRYWRIQGIFGVQFTSQLQGMPKGIYCRITYRIQYN
jgi:hypothetical protein